jgi:hypothetical protein
VIVFGGSDGANDLSDTWGWNGTAWTMLAPPDAGPSAREGLTLAYDSARHRTVLFGGGLQFSDGTFALNDETWEWNGSSWSAAAPSPRPTARWVHSAAFDEARGVVVIFGGMDINIYALHDTWTWNGTTWTPAATTGPGGRYEACMAYDGARQVVIMFGGWDGAQPLSETWEWNGTAWNQRMPNTVPVARSDCAMAYDSSRQSIVMYGGSDGTSVFDPIGDTWEWDGNDWSPAATTGPTPGPKWTHTMTYDSVRGRVVLVGGASVGSSVASPDSQTWEFGP